MKIIEVKYSALFNLGNYENEKIEFTATLEDGENPQEAITELRAKVVAASAAKFSALKRFLTLAQIPDVDRREPSTGPDEEQAEVYDAKEDGPYNEESDSFQIGNNDMPF